MAKSIVTGDREIIANLRRAYRAVGGNALRDDAFRSLEPMKEATQNNARSLRNYPGKWPDWPTPPVNPRGGHLDEGVVVVKKTSRGPLYVEVWLTFSKRSRKIAHLVEFGTAPHFQPGLGIMHPGATAHPFARPAFEETKEDVGLAMGHFAWQRISQAILLSAERRR